MDDHGSDQLFIIQIDDEPIGRTEEAGGHLAEDTGAPGVKLEGDGGHAGGRVRAGEGPGQVVAAEAGLFVRFVALRCIAV